MFHRFGSVEGNKSKYVGKYLVRQLTAAGACEVSGHRGGTTRSTLCIYPDLLEN